MTDSNELRPSNDDPLDGQASKEATHVDRPSSNDGNRESGTDVEPKQIEREVHWLEKLNIISQTSLVVVGIIAAVIYGCQLRTMNGQLNQMKGSGQQTDTLLSLYQQQLAQLTQQTSDTRILAKAAGQQAEDAEDFFRTDERAWIVIDSIEKNRDHPA